MAKYKKEVYTMIEIAERVMEKWPGRYKSIASANAAVRGAARELGIGDINGKGKYKNIAAKGAERILEHLGKNYRKTSTPLEKIAKKDEATEFLKAQLDANLEKIKENEIKLAAQAVNASAPQVQVQAIPSERNAEIFQAKPLEIKPADERQLEADYFEVRRKRFYTDVNYFLKYAQTAGERVAIWTALSKLYGIGGTINWDLQGDAVKFNPSDGKKATESTGLDANSILDI